MVLEITKQPGESTRTHHALVKISFLTLFWVPVLFFAISPHHPQRNLRESYNHSAQLVSPMFPPQWRNLLSTGNIHLVSTEWKCWTKAQNVGQCIYLDINIYIEMKGQNSFLLSGHWNLWKYKGIQLSQELHWREVGWRKSTKIEDESKNPLRASFSAVSFTLLRLLKSSPFVDRWIGNNWAYHFCANQSKSRSSLSHAVWWRGYFGDRKNIFSR